MTGKVIRPKIKSAIVTLLNDNAVKCLLNIYDYTYRYELLSTLVIETSFCSAKAVNEKMH